jgi:hypothetical protein
MSSLDITLLSDGSSDALLLRPLTWLLRQYLSRSVTLQTQWADLRSVNPRPVGLSTRMATAIELYPCSLLFVHRDAERENPEVRCAEIRESAATSVIAFPVVAVVPVRMTEAWLLFHERAVRRAAGNPNGRMGIGVPYHDAEGIADPKRVLHDALRTASGLHGRRLQKFSVHRAVQRVADYIEDFSPLRSLQAFRRLEEELRRVLATLNLGQ